VKNALFSCGDMEKNDPYQLFHISLWAETNREMEDKRELETEVREKKKENGSERTKKRKHTCRRLKWDPSYLKKVAAIVCWRFCVCAAGCDC
jgi:hypothetical protein